MYGVKYGQIQIVWGEKYSLKYALLEAFVYCRFIWAFRFGNIDVSLRFASNLFVHLSCFCLYSSPRLSSMMVSSLEGEMIWWIPLFFLHFDLTINQKPGVDFKMPTVEQKGKYLCDRWKAWLLNDHPSFALSRVNSCHLYDLQIISHPFSWIERTWRGKN